MWSALSSVNSDVMVDLLRPYPMTANGHCWICVYFVLNWMWMWFEQMPLFCYETNYLVTSFKYTLLSMVRAKVFGHVLQVHVRYHILGMGIVSAASEKEWPKRQVPIAIPSSNIDNIHRLNRSSLLVFILTCRISVDNCRYILTS